MSTLTPSGLSLDINAPIVRPKYRVQPSQHQQDNLSNEKALQTFAKFTAIANKTGKGLKKKKKFDRSASSMVTKKSTTSYSTSILVEETSMPQK